MRQEVLQAENSFSIFSSKLRSLNWGEASPGHAQGQSPHRKGGGMGHGAHSGCHRY